MTQVECNCTDWKKYIPIVDGTLTMQQLRYSRVYDIKVFIYCPYCGKKLVKSEKHE